MSQRQELLLSNEIIQHYITSELQEQALKKTEKERKDTKAAPVQSRQFLDEESKQVNVVRLESGLQYRVINKGEGSKPNDGNSVVVHYE